MTVETELRNLGQDDLVEAADRIYESGDIHSARITEAHFERFPVARALLYFVDDSSLYPEGTDLEKAGSGAAFFTFALCEFAASQLFSSALSHDQAEDVERTLLAVELVLLDEVDVIQGVGAVRSDPAWRYNRTRLGEFYDEFSSFPDIILDGYERIRHHFDTDEQSSFMRGAMVAQQALVEASRAQEARARA